MSSLKCLNKAVELQNVTLSLSKTSEPKKPMASTTYIKEYQSLLPSISDISMSLFWYSRTAEAAHLFLSFQNKNIKWLESKLTN